MTQRLSSRLRSLALVAFVGSAAGCADTCGTEVLTRLDAPDKSAAAVLFQRDCGASTGFSTQIAIIVGNQKISDANTIFVVDTNGGKAPGAAWGGPWASAEWASPKQLSVAYDGSARVFKTSDRIDDIAITYRPQQPPS